MLVRRSGCAESAAAAAAVRVVTALACRGHQEALLVLSPPLLDQLRRTMGTSDVVRYRGYEVSRRRPAGRSCARLLLQ